MNPSEFADQLDWNQIEEDAVAAASTVNKDGQKSVFMKMPAGAHKARIIPTGNMLQRLPYFSYKQHNLEVIDAEGKKQPHFILCWNYVWNNLTLQKTDKDRSEKSVLGYLIKNQIMNKDIDFPKYNKYKCPICKLYEHVDLMGVTKDLKYRYYAKEHNLFNVIWRQTPNSGDNEIYVWNVGKQHYNNLIGFARTCYKDMQLNIFDVNTGFDMRIVATGEGMLRRYTVDFLPMPTPLNLNEKIPHNLVDVGMKSYKPYQEVLNLLKQSSNKLITDTGFLLMGDESPTAQTQQMYPKREPVNMPVAPLVPPPANIIPSESFLLDNTLYDSEGKELF